MLATSVVTGSTPPLASGGTTSHGIILLSTLKPWFFELQRELHRYKPDFVFASLRKRATFLPDKVFCYFNTIIVIADVHWRLAQSATTNSQPPTTNASQQPTTNCQQPTKSWKLEVRGWKLTKFGVGS